MADDGAQVTVKENGPYLVSGSVPLRVKEPIMSEHGEPLTWQTGDALETRATYALCRCGDSAKKPFCDGAHAAEGFDGTETAPTESYEERRKSYPGTGIEVFDDRATCVHAGFCGNQVSNVWKMAGDTDDTQIRAQVMAMVEKCPSGALTFEVDGAAVEPSLPAEVGIIPDGPIWITGGIPIERADGAPVEVRNRVNLCRCGHSANKPFCDGAHKEAGFTG
ncbi:MAG: iron-binding protein [Acidimicrobiales bacterium]|nr:iron-binding protein [Acidimicrobiales bacterium]RZV48300.1 MAG: iron-binding protein [Acidimicrobiales bacterium]